MEENLDDILRNLGLTLSDAQQDGLNSLFPNCWFGGWCYGLSNAAQYCPTGTCNLGSASICNAQTTVYCNANAGAKAW